MGGTPTKLPRQTTPGSRSRSRTPNRSRPRTADPFSTRLLDPTRDLVEDLFDDESPSPEARTRSTRRCCACRRKSNPRPCHRAYRFHPLPRFGLFNIAIGTIIVFVCLGVFLVCNALFWAACAIVSCAKSRYRRKHPSLVDELSDYMPVRQLPKFSVFCLSLPPLIKTGLLFIYAGAVPAALSVTVLQLFGPGQLMARWCWGGAPLHGGQWLGTILVLCGVAVSGFTLCSGSICHSVEANDVFAFTMLSLAVLCDIIGALGQMEFLKSRRVDFVSFNAVSALSQLLIGALLLPMFAIMEMQIENLLDASNSSASVGLAPFNATLFHDFLLSGLTGFFTTGLPNSGAAYDPFLPSPWSWGGREYHDSRVLLLFYLIVSWCSIAQSYLTLRELAKRTNVSVLAGRRWESLGALSSAVAVPIATIVMAVTPSVVNLIGEPSSTSYQSYAITGGTTAGIGLLFVWLTVPAKKFRLPTTARRFEQHPRVSGPTPPRETKDGAGP